MLTRFIYPLPLREKVNGQLAKLRLPVRETNIPLEFAPSVRLNLCRHDVGHRSIIFNGFYELPLTKHIVALGKKGGIMVDVGANYGYFACLWAAANPGNRVHAFEASPLNVPALTQNVNNNGFANAICVLPYALGKQKGHLQFNLANEAQQTGWGGFVLHQQANTVSVAVETLDDYAFTHHLPHIDVLKIDTEGADTWVLYGAAALIKAQKIKHIFFENHQRRMLELQIGFTEATDFLQAHGYRLQTIARAEIHAYLP